MFGSTTVSLRVSSFAQCIESQLYLNIGGLLLTEANITIYAFRIIESNDIAVDDGTAAAVGFRSRVLARFLDI